MIDPSLKRQFLFFLAIVACLGMILKTSGHFPFTEATTGTVWCVDASLVTIPKLPTDTAGEGPCYDDNSFSESLFQVPGLPGTTLSQQRRILPTACTSFTKGFHADIYRPPITTV